MGITENVFLTGLGSRGIATGAIDTFLRMFIPGGGAGNRLVINTLHCQDLDTPSTQSYIKLMRVLDRPTVSVAGVASGTSGFTLTTANIAFGDSAKWGDATDSLAADDVVAINLSNGGWEFDMVKAVTTAGFIELDTALTGIAAVGDVVYIFGTDTHSAHTAVQLSTKQGDSYFDVAVGEEKGDPMMITNSSPSTVGTFAAGASVTNVQYSYVNK